MELTGDSMEVKPIMTRKLRRRPNDPVPIPDKRRKPAPAQLNYLLTDEQIMEDLRTLNKLKSPKRPASPSSPEHLPATPAESPAQRFEARIEDGKLYYDKRWYHKSQAIYLESKDNQKLSCVISSVGANEIWVRKTSDSTKMRIYLGQLQRGLFVIRRRSAAWLSAVLFSWPFFWSGFYFVLFCFVLFCFLNRNMLTSGNSYSALEMESTVVDSLRHFCGWSLPTLSVFSASTSSRDRSPGDYFTFRSIGGLIYFPFISLFFAYTCFWKPLSLKGQLFLLSLGLYIMEKSRKGYTLQCIFMFWIWLVDYVATFPVEPNSLFPQKLGAEVLAGGDEVSWLSAFSDK